MLLLSCSSRTTTGCLMGYAGDELGSFGKQCGIQEAVGARMWDSAKECSPLYMAMSTHVHTLLRSDHQKPAA